jgi:hypothetical protein
MATDDIEFEPAWNYPEDRWRPKRPMPQIERSWPNERLARLACEDALSGYFELVPEVRLLERGQPFQYIDYVAICPEDWPVRVFGIEVKRGFPKLKDGCDVVDQMRRYRRAVISDDRVAVALGDRLPYVFCWPGLDLGDDCSHKQAGRALRIYAGRSNVGSIDREYRWLYGPTPDLDAWRLRVRLTCGQEAFWTSQGFEMVAGYFGVASKHADRLERGMRTVE